MGPGGYFWRYPAYILTSPPLELNLRHPHNLLLEMGTTFGLLGLIWLLVLLGWLWRRFNTRPANEERWIVAGLVASLAAGLAHGHVDAFGSLADVAAANWVVIGVLVGCPNLKIGQEAIEKQLVKSTKSCNN